MADSLPSFQKGKLYLVRGDSLNQILATLRAWKPCATEGGGLKLDLEDASGRFFSVDLGQLPIPDGGIPDPPASGNYVLTAQNGVLSWEVINDC